MDPNLPLFLQICLSIVIVGGAIVVILGIVALFYIIRLSRQVSDVVTHGRDSIMRLSSLGESVIEHVKQALQIAQVLRGVVSTLQKNRGRGKK